MSSAPVLSDLLNIWAACLFLWVLPLCPYVGVQQGGILCRTVKRMVEDIPRMMEGFPHGKPESKQKPSYLSSCCVMLTSETTRLIEEKELIVSGTF